MKWYSIGWLVLIYLSTVSSALNSVWRWDCEKNSCQRKRITNDTESSALNISIYIYCTMVLSNIKWLKRKYYEQSILVILITFAIVFATVCFILFKSIKVVVVDPQSSALNSVWRWDCEKNSCQRKRITNDTESSALNLSIYIYCTMVLINIKWLKRKYNAQSILVILITFAIVFATVCFILLKSIKVVVVDPQSSALNSVWRWDCEKNSCQRKRITNDTESSALSLPACRIFCSDSAALWPKPTGNFSIGTLLTKINANSIDVVSNASGTSIGDLVNAAAREFKMDVEASITSSVQSGGRPVFVTLKIVDTASSKLTLETDESYSLNIDEDSTGKSIQVTITAPTFFGARNGLQSLSQLIIFDDLRNELQIPNNAAITDKPAFPHRGIVLDTSRNYVSVDVIKRTLKAMGASKLNTFHWHITDTHSFPYVTKSLPNLSKLGAYSPSKVYTPKDVKEITEYATIRGVRVIPEFDAPAHVGEGWQDTGFVVCLNAQPWQTYCVEPPCGQFDPTKDGLYDALEDIYGDMIDQFNPDVFHMGGDEVKFTCWENTSSIVEWMANKGWNATDEGFVKLWTYFQDKALERLYKKAGREIPVILWTSQLTELDNLLTALPKEKYIIQVWTTGTDTQVTNLLENGYKVILSNYDALYLDCGFAGWVTNGNNWCSPYIGWQKIYENKPETIAGTRVNQVLGAEAALWSEQADTASVDTRLWPRSAALAEVLWTNPSTGWEKAEHRFLVQRERLLHMGINADTIEPEWCLQNEENCRIGSTFNV